ncbi:U7 snRNA-associated Sm-like protein LSm10 [Bradysia coprophila]|uniref:U7 snRNA-associated Sm-like protein LSm10 n=1 Tax=Bradysia coprophila TaxID=38358 RepID=UPI00187D6F78|nr:U7 snRNA-associated Sm-like protein LSm10 [Bradysia coprophila]
MSENKPSRLENYLQYNTLTIVPHILRNTNTILDLRNETSVAGTIFDVDGYMNITMTNAVFVDQRNNQHSFESYFVPARTIRYIHIPESMNIQSAINDFLMSKHRPNRPKKVFSFKIRRAERRHQATLRELAQSRKQN